MWWCIYRTRNKINGHTYIGQHKYEHLYDGYIGSGKILKLAIKKYGIENFDIEYLVTRIPNREYADKEEKKYITIERSYNKAEYNILDGGQGFQGGHHSEEAKRKIGLAALGNQYAKGCNIGNQYAKGNILSEETKKQMGISRLGNSNNGVAYIQCIETGEIKRTNEWIKAGYKNAYNVAKGRRKTCKGFHFKYISLEEE